MKRNSKAGFTLLELLVVVAILTLIMGVVFKQIDNVQKMSRNENVKLDLTQEGREFVDLFIRDVHQAGFPGSTIYAPGALGTPAANDSKAAVGLVKFAYDEVWLEADVNGDGVADSINYKLQTGVNGNCPCTIRRSQVTKSNGVAPTSQTISYTMGLKDVINSGGANGGASGSATYSLSGTSYVGGSNQSNNTLYSEYKAANVFTAYDATGTPVSPADFVSGAATLKTIKTIRINVNLMAGTADMQTGRRAVIPLAATADVGNN